jgi:polysaccharide biosynthesis/export protein
MRLSLWVLGLFILFTYSSCVSKQTIPAYFQGGFDTTAINNLKYVEPVVQQGDILYIGVNSALAKPADVLMYNLPNYYQGSLPTAVSQSQAVGYMVGNDGMINFPQLGKIKVLGMRKAQIAQDIESRLTKVLQEPTVTVRFLNYRVTVLGEVTKAGTFTIPNEKVTIIEALGMAGDITMYGKKQNVLVIRENNGNKQFAHVDLTKTDIFSSPYFYLQQNDVVVVESDDYKIKNLDNISTRNVNVGLSIASAVASVGFLIVSILNLNK